MSINTALLISSPTLQDYLVDKNTGLPLSNGIVTMYKDNSRTTLKNWYYQTGIAGAYTFATLPNPMVLSSVGTIVDVNGNDTLPFYYPFSETDNATPEKYYVTITDSNGNVQEIRQNFPWIATEEPSPTGPFTNHNYIINNRFWRNNGTQSTSTPYENSIALTNVTNSLTTNTIGCLCPSQHDGFSMPDFQFFKSATGAVETLTFKKFALGSDPLSGDITPEFYVNHTCTAAGSETYKYYQFPISLHIKTLDSVPASVTIQLLNGSGNQNNTITLSILQFLGTNASSPAAVQIATLTAPSSWTKFTIPFTTASATGLTLSETGDDAFYLQIGIPAGKTTNINFALPSFYLSPSIDVPTNDFATYDEIDTVICSPRTGDIRTSLNNFGFMTPGNSGWVPANDTTIGSPASNSTGRANTDTWPLFNLIWANVNNTYAPIYDSAGVASTRGVSAYADFIANKRLALTQTLGRVIAGNWNGTPEVLGFTEGSATTSQVPNHVHTFTSSNGFVQAGGSETTLASPGAFGVTNSVQATGTTNNNTGGVSSISLMQPTVYYNVYIKL